MAEKVLNFTGKEVETMKTVCDRVDLRDRTLDYTGLIIHFGWGLSEDEEEERESGKQGTTEGNRRENEGRV